MRYRTFGRTGWQIAEVGYGMWGMGGWSGSDDAESRYPPVATVEKYRSKHPTRRPEPGVVGLGSALSEQ